MTKDSKRNRRQLVDPEARVASDVPPLPEEQEPIRLNESESQAFVAELLNPSRPNLALRNAKLLFLRTVEAR